MPTTAPIHPALTHPATMPIHRRALLATRRPLSGALGKLCAREGTGYTLLQPTRADTGHRMPEHRRDPEAGTASWRWVPAGTPELPDGPGGGPCGRHVVAIYTGVRRVADGLSAAPADALTAYARFSAAVVRHEVAHAERTTRETAVLTAALRMAGVPFRLWNLFEDVRIEEATRASERPFYWARFVNLPARIAAGEAADPRGWVWLTKSAECRGARPVRGAIHPAYEGPASTATGAPARATLFRIYDAAATAADSFAVVAVCAEFLTHFPDAATAPWPSEASDPGDRIPGTGDERDGIGAPGSATPPAPKPPTPPAPKPPTPPRILSREESEGGRGGMTAEGWAPCPRVVKAWATEAGIDVGPYTTPSPPPADRDLVRALAARLGRIVHAVADRPASVGEEGRRVHIPALAGGDPACWLRPAPTPGRPRLVLVVDMSASMHGIWYTCGGRELVLAFVSLARAGRIELVTWLTGYRHPVRLPASAPDAVWVGLSPKFGVESYPEALEQARADLMRARLAVCYSDGSLTDGDIDVSGWRARGVDLVGTCIAHPDHVTAMEELGRRNFGRAVVDSSAPGLASRLAVALSRRR